ncbi:MAG: hypothetical protein ABI859_18840 [Pseudomonadota bacterium]
MTLGFRRPASLSPTGAAGPWLAALLAVCLPAAGWAQQAKPPANPVYDRAASLCLWLKKNPPPEMVGQPAVCDPSRKLNVQETRDDIRQWFGLWEMRQQTGHPDPEAAFDAWHRERLNARLANQGNNREAYKRYVAISDLCTDYHRRGSIKALAELKRRNPFEPRDMDLVLVQKVALGMSEDALICSWGPTQMRPVGEPGDGGRIYDYGEVEIGVEHGVVLTIDDRRG